MAPCPVAAYDLAAVVRPTTLLIIQELMSVSASLPSGLVSACQYSSSLRCHCSEDELLFVDEALHVSEQVGGCIACAAA